jgi:hypothetical protein
MISGHSRGQEFYDAAPRAPDLLCFLQFWVVLDPYFEVDFSIIFGPEHICDASFEVGVIVGPKVK